MGLDRDGDPHVAGRPLRVRLNRRRAAMNLNISYRTLLYKIQRHGLTA